MGNDNTGDREAISLNLEGYRTEKVAVLP